MIELPAHFLATASYWNERKNPYRYRVEVGGYLVADPANPDRIRFATGPGRDAQHDYSELTLSRSEMSAAVESAGFSLVGCWHTHPANSHVDPSPDDQEAWQHDLKRSILEEWRSVILRRDDEKRWVEMSGWSTRWKDGAYRTEPALITPPLATARELISEMAWHVSRSSLVDQDAWVKEPYRLYEELAALDVHSDLVGRMRLKKTNERLKRLGMKELTLLPIPRREVEIPGEVIHGDGTLIRRVFTPPKITVR